MTTTTTSTTLSSGGLPAPWTSGDIGATGIAGSASYAGGTFTVNGSGADIWGSADAFHFVRQPWSGDGRITARVTGVQDTSPWAKAGVMMRATLAANSAHAMVMLTPGFGWAFQSRASTGSSSVHTAGGGATAPTWVRLTRTGDTLTAEVSSDGVTWQPGGSVSIPLGASIQVGLAVTAHDNSVLSTATFDNVSVTTAAPPTTTTTLATTTTTVAPTTTTTLATTTTTVAPTTTTTLATTTTTVAPTTTTTLATTTTTLAPTTTTTVTTTTTTTSTTLGELPAPWTSGDVGATGIPGSAGYSAGTFTVNGSGADIWNTTDAFHFARQTWSGDGRITARVTSVQNTDPGAKAGVMIRETLSPDSKHAMIVLTPGNGLAFQRRTSTGGSTTETPGGTAAAPYWIRLMRTGSTFVAEKSTDGASWVQVGFTTINMTTTAYVGLVVTARNNSVLNTSTFDNVSVVPVSSTAPQEAEAATVVGADVRSRYSGYTGTGYVDYQHGSGDYIEWTVNVAAAGSYVLDFRYANGSGSDRPLALSLNGAVISGSLAFPPSGTWSSWRVLSVPATLSTGNNTVRLTATGSNGANLDSLTVR